MKRREHRGDHAEVCVCVLLSLHGSVHVRKCSVLVLCRTHPQQRSMMRMYMHALFRVLLGGGGDADPVLVFITL